MTETANNVITDALQEILVQAAESPLTPDEYATAIRYLNRMMSAWALSGVNIGYTEVTSLGDVLTVPSGAIEGIISNLALKLAPMFGAEIPITLLQKASDGLKAIEHTAVRVFPTSFGSTLPIGSGNEGDFNDNHYYPGLDQGILTEQGGFISTESDTPIGGS